MSQAESKNYYISGFDCILAEFVLEDWSIYCHRYKQRIQRTQHSFRDVNEYLETLLTDIKTRRPQTYSDITMIVHQRTLEYHLPYDKNLPILDIVNHTINDDHDQIEISSTEYSRMLQIGKLFYKEFPDIKFSIADIPYLIGSICLFYFPHMASIFNVTKNPYHQAIYKLYKQHQYDRFREIELLLLAYHRGDHPLFRNFEKHLFRLIFEFIDIPSLV